MAEKRGTSFMDVPLLIFNINAKQRKQKYYIEYKKKYKEKPIVKFRKSFLCHITMESKSL